MLKLIQTIAAEGALWRQYRHPSLGEVGTEVRLGREGAADVITLVRADIDFARAACGGEEGSEPFPLKPGPRRIDRRCKKIRSAQEKHGVTKLESARQM